MKSTIILLTCCIFGLATASCRCDIDEEEETRNKNINKTTKSERKNNVQ